MRVSRFIRRIRDANPNHHAIAKSMAWVAFFVLLSGVARAAKEIAIAYRYGVGAEVDAYAFVFNLINWPISVWLSVLTVILVPLAARMQHTAPSGLPQFRAELLGFSLLLGVALATLAWLGLPPLLSSSWTGLPESSKSIAIDLTSGLFLLAPLGVMISLLSAWMMAAGRHANTLLEGAPAIVIALTILVMPGGADLLMWATLGGFVFHLALLGLTLARDGSVEAPRFTYRSPEWRPFWQGFSVMLIGQALMTSSTVIDQFFASHLGTGAIGTLSYANRILALVLGLGAAAVSRATLPVFSRMEAAGDRQSHQVALRWSGFLLILSLPLAVGLWWLAPWGVELFFQRGAFTPKDTLAVSDILQYGLLQLPFYFASLPLVSLLASQHRHHVLSVIGVINLAVKALLNAVLAPEFGLNGIMLATSLMYLGSLAFLLFIVKKQN